LNLKKKLISQSKQLRIGMEDLIKVLYVDDELHNLTSFKASFRRHFEIYTAISADEGKKILEENEIHVLVTDQRMPGTPGTELLAYAVQKFPEQMRILLTGFSDMDALKDAVNRGQIYKYLQKPWSEEEIISSINMAYEIHLLRLKEKRQNANLKLSNEQLEFMLRQKLLS
jgi:response regulator RpfG family c-di-GMP phosphodiesterase